MPIVFSTLDPSSPPPPPPPSVPPFIAALTDDDILNLGAGMGQIATGVVWELLDKNMNPITTLHPRRDVTASVEVRASDTTKRVLRDLALTPEEYALVDVNADRIRPSWQLETGTVFPLGVFLFSDVSLARTSAGTPMTGMLTDQTVLLDQPREKGLALPAGSWGVSIDLVILNLVAECGVTQFDIPKTGLLAPMPIGWSAGTSIYEMLAGLFALCDFFPPFFDNLGVLRGKPISHDLSDTNFDHDYGEGGRIIAGSITETDDTVKAPNRYLVTDNGPTQAPIAAVYDIPARWPHSYANRGRYVVSKVNVNGLKSVAAAQRAARRAAIVDLRAGLRSISFDATPDPRHDIYETVRYRGTTYREEGWTLALAPGGPMTHRLRGRY